MSITEIRNGDAMENGSGDSCISAVAYQERGFVDGGEKMFGEERENSDNVLESSNNSSIGKNSDDDFEEEEEVQSCYKCEDFGSFDSIQALEKALPIRRGMSRFYNGKSKSFTSLADASSSSTINDIVKPENPYSRRRRNLLACSLISDRNRSFHLKSSGGVSKRSSRRTTLALAVAMNSPKNHELRKNSDSMPTLISKLSPFHSQILQTNHVNLSSSPREKFSAWRSFSLADLAQCASLKAPAPL